MNTSGTNFRVNSLDLKQSSACLLRFKILIALADLDLRVASAYFIQLRHLKSLSCHNSIVICAPFYEECHHKMKMLEVSGTLPLRALVNLY